MADPEPRPRIDRERWTRDLIALLRERIPETEKSQEELRAFADDMWETSRRMGAEIRTRREDGPPRH